MSRARSDSPILRLPPFLIAAWGAVLLLWVLGVIHEAGAGVFFLVVATGFAYTGALIRQHTRTESGWTTLRMSLLFLLIVVVPVAFDIGTADVFNLTKFTVLIIGAVIAAAVGAGELLVRGRPVLWRNGLQWPVLALVIWTAVATFTGVDLEVGLLGYYASYDGLFTALALAFLFLLVADTVTINGVRPVLAALVLGAGGPIVFYGFMQMHDQLFAGRDWDWIEWGGPSSFGSTMANPNHLAGFYAVVLPLALVLAVTSRSRWERAFVGLVGAGALLQTLFVQTRGAWVAIIVAALVFLAVVFDEIKAIVRTKPRLVFGAIAGVVVGLLAAAVLLGPALDLGSRVRSLFELSGISTTAQRIELWSAATEMALNDPVTGVGVDSFTLVFPAYQDLDFVTAFGPNQKPIQPHNVFFTHLANEGFPGLLAFLAILVTAFLRGIGASRRLRRRYEQDGAPEARDARLLLAGVITGLAAYVVQASFDIQQIGLSFTFWLLLGLLAAIAVDAGVPVSLKPSVLLDPQQRSELTHPTSGAAGKKKWASTSRHQLPIASSRGTVRRARVRSSGALPIGVAAVAVVGIALCWFTSRLYIADHHYASGKQKRTLAEQPDVDSNQRIVYFSDAEELFRDAHSANPWEPRYPREAGRVDFILGSFYIDNSDGDHDELERGLELLRRSLDLYEQAIALRPQDSYVLSAKAEVLLKINRTDPSEETARQEAIDALEAATTYNPREALFYTQLVGVLIRSGDEETAREVVERGLRYRPDSAELIELAHKLGFDA